MSVAAGDLVQAGIVACSATAAWLVNSPGQRQRGIGAVVGLCGQPLWFVAAWQAGQWGILALSAWYTLAWTRGLLHWLRPKHRTAKPGTPDHA